MLCGSILEMKLKMEHKVNRSIFNIIHHYILTIKKLFSDILNYFLADAEVQTILVGSVIAFQMTSLVLKQVKEQVKIFR
jgi:hypothetical protein